MRRWCCRQEAVFIFAEGFRNYYILWRRRHYWRYFLILFSRFIRPAFADDSFNMKPTRLRKMTLHFSRELFFSLSRFPARLYGRWAYISIELADALRLSLARNMRVAVLLMMLSLCRDFDIFHYYGELSPRLYFSRGFLWRTLAAADTYARRADVYFRMMRCAS